MGLIVFTLLTIALKPHLSQVNFSLFIWVLNITIYEKVVETFLGCTNMNPIFIIGILRGPGMPLLSEVSSYVLAFRQLK